MDAERIVQVASELNCSPPETAVQFVRIIAEHCAEIADEAAGVSSSPAGNAIRQAFRLL